jgi:Co/Zn/Cd efflux system component
MILAGLLLLPALALLWALWGKWTAPSVPAPFALSLTGLGALVVNVSCALLLARFRDRAGSLTKAAYLSARNDALANFAIIAAGLTTLLHPSIWPDVIVGLGIAILNADAAREVWEAARNERGAGDQRA